MAKNNITQYDATAANNTDIDSINIDEGMAASDVNNALRSLMSHLKNVDTGSQALTALSVTGAITGGSLSIDNITIDSTEIDLSSGSFTIDSAANITLDCGTGEFLFNNGSNGNLLKVQGDSSNVNLITMVQDKDLVFKGNDGGSTIEAMRIDMSEGGRVGIGATTVDRQLHLEADNSTTYSSSDFDQAYNLLKIENNNTTNNVATGLQFLVGTNGSASITTTRTGDGAASLCFGTRGGGARAERMRIDSSGNVGIGTSSPSSFNGGANNLVVGTGSGSEGISIFAANDSNSAIFFADGDSTTTGQINYQHASNAFTFHTNGGTERMRIHSDGNVSIGTGSASANLHIQGTSGNDQVIVGNSAEATQFRIRVFHDDQTVLMSRDGDTARHLVFQTGITEKARIQDNGNFLIGTTNQSPAESSSATGLRLGGNGGTQISVSGLEIMRLNRNTNDGTLINFCQASTSEGHISISGTTVSYNGGHLSRFSQLTDNTRDDTIVKGTVMTNLDQMAEWTTDGVTEDNEQLNCMAVSSVEGDINVAGVFVNWDNDDKVYTNDMNVAMTGDMVIRIAKGTTVARGDLLMSAGDGTAKPQGDDIVRSKTIAKVTSTNVSHTYNDGTYLVPCVLMAC